MKRVITLTPEAAEDLEDIISYVSDRNESAAVMLFETFQAAFRRLSEFPELGVRRERLLEGGGALRMWPLPAFPHYTVYYCPTEAGVEIVRVLHSARDIPRLFDDE